MAAVDSLSARTAADASIAQRTSIEELSHSAVQLSQTAARMRALALRHTLRHTLRHPIEFAATMPPAEFAPVAAAPPTDSRPRTQTRTLPPTPAVKSMVA